MSDEAGAAGDPGWRERELDRLTRGEQLAGVERVKRWPPEARRELLALPAAERDLILLAAAELDIEPGAPQGRPDDVIEIDLR